MPGTPWLAGCYAPGMGNSALQYDDGYTPFHFPPPPPSPGVVHHAAAAALAATAAPPIVTSFGVAGGPAAPGQPAWVVKKRTATAIEVPQTDHLVNVDSSARAIGQQVAAQSKEFMQLGGGLSHVNGRCLDQVFVVLGHRRDESTHRVLGLQLAGYLPVARHCGLGCVAIKLVRDPHTKVVNVELASDQHRPAQEFDNGSLGAGGVLLQLEHDRRGHFRPRSYR